MFQTFSSGRARVAFCVSAAIAAIMLGCGDGSSTPRASSPEAADAAGGPEPAATSGQTPDVSAPTASAESSKPGEAGEPATPGEGLDAPEPRSTPGTGPGTAAASDAEGSAESSTASSDASPAEGEDGAAAPDEGVDRAAAADGVLAEGLAEVRSLVEDGRFVDAYRAARELLAVHSGSPGAAQLRTIMAEIRPQYRLAPQVRFALDKLASEDPIARQAAARELADFGPDAWPFLERVVLTAEPETAVRAYRVLARRVAPRRREVLVRRLAAEYREAGQAAPALATLAEAELADGLGLEHRLRLLAWAPGDDSAGWRLAAPGPTDVEAETVAEVWSRWTAAEAEAIAGEADPVDGDAPAPLSLESMRRGGLAFLAEAFDATGRVPEVLAEMVGGAADDGSTPIQRLRAAADRRAQRRDAPEDDPWLASTREALQPYDYQRLTEGLVGWLRFEGLKGRHFPDAARSDGKGWFARGVGASDLVEGRAGQAVRFAPDDARRDKLIQRDDGQMRRIHDDDYSFAAWVKVSGPQARRSEDRIGHVFAKRGWHMGLALSESNVPMMRHMLLGGEGVVATAEEPIPEGEWVHLAGVVDREAGDVTVHVNGELAGRASFPSDHRAATRYNNDPVTVGMGEFRSSSGRDQFEGSIDEAMIFNRTLKLQDLMALQSFRPARLLDELNGR